MGNYLNSFIFRAITLINYQIDNLISKFLPSYMIKNPQSIKRIFEYEYKSFYSIFMISTEHLMFRNLNSSKETSSKCIVCGKIYDIQKNNNKSCIYQNHYGNLVGIYLDASCNEGNSVKSLVGSKWSCCNFYKETPCCITSCHLSENDNFNSL